MIDWLNGLFFKLFFRRKLERILPAVIHKYSCSGITCRKLDLRDINDLFELIESQDPTDLKYFQPHGFDMPSLYSQFKKPSFLMMGAFSESRIIGYFFLRFFSNKKCFVGRLIDKEFRGKGVGSIMNNIMYETGWRMGFRCLSTISRNNKAVMKAHSKNPSLKILRELQNDYLLVEFIKPVK